MNERIRYGPGQVDKRNASGCQDPTAYEALSHIKQSERSFLPMVYICSPFRGDEVANTKKARHYCRFAVDTGHIPLAPHIFVPQYMDDSDPEERELALFMNFVFISKCNELWVMGGRISDGMQREIEKAKVYKKKIRYFTEDLKEVSEWSY